MQRGLVRGRRGGRGQTLFSADALQPMPFWLLLWWSGNSLMTRRRLTCCGLRAATGAKGSATRLFVAEHDVKLRLYFFAAIARESTVSQHLHHAGQQQKSRRLHRRRSNEQGRPPPNAHPASTLASSPLRACSARIFFPNSSTRLLVPASSIAADTDADVSTCGCGFDALASSLDIAKEVI